MKKRIAFSFWLAVTLVALVAPRVLAQEPAPLDKITYLPMVFNDYDPTWQFAAPLEVKLTPYPFNDPYVVIDSSGRTHIFWDTLSSNQYFIYHTYLDNGSWSTPTPIAPTLGRSTLLHQPVVGSNNQIYIVWKNELTLGRTYRILYAAWDGTNWGPEFNLLNWDYNYVDGLVRLDAAGIPHVAYAYSGIIYNYIGYQKWTGSGFSASYNIPDPSYPTIVWLDNNGGLALFSRDYDHHVHYSYWKDGAFRVNDRIVAGDLDYRTSLLDASSNLHLIDVDSVPVPGGNVTGIYHQCLTNQLGWTDNIILTGQANVENVQVTFNDRNQLLVAWSQDNDNTIGVSFWDGCQQTKQNSYTLPDITAGYDYGNFVDISQNTQAGKICLLSEKYVSIDSYWLSCTR